MPSPCRIAAPTVACVSMRLSSDDRLWMSRRLQAAVAVAWCRYAHKQPSIQWTRWLALTVKRRRESHWLVSFRVGGGSARAHRECVASPHLTSRSLKTVIVAKLCRKNAIDDVEGT